MRNLPILLLFLCAAVTAEVQAPFKVYTLSYNGWSLPYYNPFIDYIIDTVSCLFRIQRKEALPQLIINMHNEIIATGHPEGLEVLTMQEMWSIRVFTYIEPLIVPAVFHECKHHAGQGLMTCSRYKILSIEARVYSVNGHPTSFLKADWFGAKGYTFAYIIIKNVKFLVFNTHVNYPFPIIQLYKNLFNVH
jgi:hypothetical protein